MKLKYKITSLILIICIIASIFPFTTIAEMIDNNNLTPVVDFNDPNTKPDGKIVSEDLSKRESNVKHFIKDDHTYEAAIYPFAVHYLEDGKWKNIDNSLVDSTDENNNPITVNKANDFKVKIAKNTNTNKLVSIKKDNYEISWGIKNTKESVSNIKTLKTSATEKLTVEEKKLLVSKTHSSLAFNNVFENIDLQYVIESSGVKENFIIKQKVDNPKFEFNLDTKNLTPQLTVSV